MRRNNGFTLIELSIVLVIIGLIVGGVLVGRDLIKAAEIRAQVGQIEKFDTAVRTFSIKYDALPGDLTAAQITKFGFTVYGNPQEGNNNGIIEDAWGNSPIVRDWYEPFWFWVQLSDAKLIDGFYTFVNLHHVTGETRPQAKMGPFGIIPFTSINNKTSYFLGTDTNTFDGSDTITSLSIAGVISPIDAYALDTKMDDGFPLSGRVRTATAPATYDTTSSSCITSAAANTYNTTVKSLNCRLIIEGQ